MDNVHNFRNWCAENGTELTPKQAKKMVKAYQSLKNEITTAIESCPNFYLELCNRTTEEKLGDVQRMKEKGCEMTLNEYNELQGMIKSICEIEGYG